MSKSRLLGAAAFEAMNATGKIEIGKDLTYATGGFVLAASERAPRNQVAAIETPFRSDAIAQIQFLREIAYGLIEEAARLEGNYLDRVERAAVRHGPPLSNVTLTRHQ